MRFDDEACSLKLVTDLRFGEIMYIMRGKKVADLDLFSSNDASKDVCDYGRNVELQLSRIP